MSFANPTDSPDFQGGPGLGGSVILNVPNGNLGANATQTFGTFYCGSANGISLAFTSTSLQSIFSILWCATSNVNTPFLQTNYIKKFNIFTVDLVSVIAPFVGFSVQDTSGVASTFTITACITTSSSGLPSGAISRTMILTQAVALAANSSATFTPSIVIPGPASLFVGATTATVRALLLAPQSSGSPFFQAAGVAAVTTPPAQSGTVAVPNDDFEIQVGNNAAAAQTVNVSLISLR